MAGSLPQCPHLDRQFSQPITKGTGGVSVATIARLRPLHRRLARAVEEIGADAAGGTIEPFDRGAAATAGAGVEHLG